MSKYLLSNVNFIKLEDRYHSAYRKKREPATRFMFHCAQTVTRQHKPKKGDNCKTRDKDRMYTFECRGWLHITIMDDTDIALVKYNHEDDHVPYWDVEIPLDIKEFISNNVQMKPTQVSAVYCVPCFLN